jgi:hypothetical protein
VRKPGASIVSHAILPGMLNLLFEEVLPAPYQEMHHCRLASCFLSILIVLEMWGSYQREVLKLPNNPFPILSRRRHVVFDECHVDDFVSAAFLNTVAFAKFCFDLSS